MCESSAFLLGKNNELTRVMENVVDVTPTNGKVYLTDLLGEEKILVETGCISSKNCLSVFKSFSIILKNTFGLASAYTEKSDDCASNTLKLSGENNSSTSLFTASSQLKANLLLNNSLP